MHVSYVQIYLQVIDTPILLSTNEYRERNKEVDKNSTENA